jgi:hypothetical protein
MVKIHGLDKYRPEAVARPVDYWVALANEKVRVEDVINEYFAPDLPIPYQSTSWKTSCPFQFEHEDFGFEKQFRVYSETNSCYCFKMHGHMDPVILWQSRLPGANRRVAAIDLLETYGIETKTKNWKERFRETAAERTMILDPAPVMQAFQVMLHSLPDYGKRQFEADVIDDVDVCLKEIARKVPTFHTYETMARWYSSLTGIFIERYSRV